jgi:hypothetical protein
LNVSFNSWIRWIISNLENILNSHCDRISWIQINSECSDKFVIFEGQIYCRFDCNWLL